jgi:hypothetical protein
MYELRSTRVRTDRVLSVPGTDFQPGPQIASISASWAGAWHRFPVRPQIASIPPRPGTGAWRPWQVPGTDFQSGRRLLASRRVLGRCLAPTSTCRRVPGRCLAPTSTWHRLPPGTDLAAVSIRSGRSPKLRVLGRCLAPISSPPRRLLASCRVLGQVPGTDLAWHRLGRRIDTLGSEPQATVDPPRRMPGARPWAGAWHRFGRTDLAALSTRSGRSPKLQWIRRVGCLAY